MFPGSTIDNPEPIKITAAAAATATSTAMKLFADVQVALGPQDAKSKHYALQVLAELINGEIDELEDSGDA